MSRQLRTRALLSVLALVFGAAASASHAATFLFVEGVPGESTDSQHRDWIDLLEFGQTLEPATRKDRGVCEGVALKRLDAASPALWSAVATQTLFPKMTVEITAGSPEDPAVVFHQEMQNVRVARVRFGERDEVPIERITLAPQQVAVRYRQLNPDGTPGAEVNGFIDCQGR